MKLSPIIFKDNELTSISYAFNQADPIFVWDVGYHKTPPSHTFGPAIRPYYLLHVIESGKGEVERDGTITKLSAGQAFLIRQGEVTTYRADKDEPWTYYWISFSGSFAKTLVERSFSSLFPTCKKSGLIAIKTLIESEIKDTVGTLNALLTVLDAVHSEEHTVRNRSEADAIASALSYLENNYFRDVDVSALSSMLGFSRAYFTTLFAKKTGETPYNYLLKTRIKKAKEYLADESRSIEEISYSVGFSSAQRFCEIFKKQVGVSPLKFRKQLSLA